MQWWVRHWYNHTTYHRNKMIDSYFERTWLRVALAAMCSKITLLYMCFENEKAQAAPIAVREQAACDRALRFGLNADKLFLQAYHTNLLAYSKCADKPSARMRKGRSVRCKIEQLTGNQTDGYDG